MCNFNLTLCTWLWTLLKLQNNEMKEIYFGSSISLYLHFSSNKACRFELRLLKCLWDYVFMVRMMFVNWKEVFWTEIDVEQVSQNKILLMNNKQLSFCPYWHNSSLKYLVSQEKHVRPKLLPFPYKSNLENFEQLMYKFHRYFSNYIDFV